MEPAEYPLPENEILLPENGADIENYTSIAFAKKMVEVRTAASMLHAYKMSYDTVLNTDTLKHRAFLAALLHYKDSLRVYIDKYRLSTFHEHLRNIISKLRTCAHINSI